MSSIDSPSEIQPAAEKLPDLGMRPLVLPPTLAGLDSSGGGAGAVSVEMQQVLASLRRFHLSGVPTTTPEGVLFPAHLYAAAEANPAMSSTLLLLAADAEMSGAGGAYLLWPFFTERLGKSLPESNGNSVLGGRVEQFQRCVHELLERGSGSAPAHRLLADAGRALRGRLELEDAVGDALLKEISEICAGWGEDARILLPNDHAYLQLLVHVARDVYRQHRSSLHQQIEQLAELLNAFLSVEATKDAKARDAGGLQQTMGSVGASFLDTSELSKSLGPWRGATQLPLEQRQRAEEILATLQEALRQDDVSYVVLVHDGYFDASVLSDEPGCELVSHEDPCRGASDLFEVRAREATTLFRDMHIAHLLLENRYEPERHDPWFERFDWQGFTPEEFFQLPMVVAVDAAERLAGDHLSALSQLLLSGKPTQVVAWQSPWDNPAEPDEELMSQFRVELGYLGIGHRKALVQQGSIRQPEHLLDAYRRALESPHPALHVLPREQASATETDRAWLESEAAILGRAHPLFCYNPDAGSTWARRMDFSGNPDPQEDWPTQLLQVETAEDSTQEWSLPTTFADFVLPESRFRSHFMRVPDDCRSSDLVRLDSYLQLPVEDASLRIPWIWACDASGSLQRLVLSRRLVQACRDRLDYWNTLQELAGIRNQYVEEAIETAREEDRLAHEAECQRLAAEHAAQVESLERETVKQSMRRLSRMLLDLDPLASLASDAGSAAPVNVPLPQEMPMPDASVAELAPEVEAAEVEEEEQEIDEPWIESILCTSCNDCLGINPKLFVYNENKQALIGDLSSGTFAQLVQAAEKCPAHCIHPGKPLNPQEPKLDSLIERAAPYN